MSGTGDGVTVVTKEVVRGNKLISNISRQIPSRILPRLERAANRAARYHNDFIDANFQRRAAHRKNPQIDPTPLHGSFYGGSRVVRGGSKPKYAADLKSHADPRKVAFAEKGEKAHDIKPRSGRYLVFPKYAGAEGNAQGVAKGQWAGYGKVHRKKRKGKPDQEAAMRRALNDVLRRGR